MPYTFFMGLNTRGYIKGIGLLELAGLVNTVLRRNRGACVHNQGNVELVDGYSQKITSAKVHFAWDLRAVYRNPNGFGSPTLSEDAEHRRLWISSDVKEEGSVDLPGSPETVWGCLDVNLWGSAEEIIKLFLTEAKAQGYECYFQYNDCADDPTPVAF